ncbi:hypothetical protein NMD1_03045 [Novosphingobium sp. MD-1]|nr:hypothetical protein NMD1_03045 [Novosphingobium sp. MD-1]
MGAVHVPVRAIGRRGGGRLCKRSGKGRRCGKKKREGGRGQELTLQGITPGFEFRAFVMK